MAQQYKRIGTTTRADPVNNTNLLFPNGYNRNEETPARPLVMVLDIADSDDTYCEEDFAFKDDDNQIANVTVTISLCSDGIITKTEANKRDDVTNRHTDNTVEDVSYDELEGATGTSEVSENRVSDYNVTDDTIFYDAVGEIAPHPSETIVSNREQIKPTNDSLFEEYERFVDRTSPTDNGSRNTKKYKRKGSLQKSSSSSCDEFVDSTDDINSAGATSSICSTQRVVKPKVKIVQAVALKSFQNETVSPSSTHLSPEDSPKPNECKRSNSTCNRKLFSPKTKTPIVIESSSDNTDEGQDFMTYLQELRRTSSIEADDDNSVESLPSSPLDNNHLQDPIQSNISLCDNTERMIDRRNSDVDQREQSITQQSDRRASIDVIVISDNEDDNMNDSLMEFNFTEFTGKKSDAKINDKKEESDENKHVVTVSAQISSTCLDDSNDIIEISDVETDDEEEDEEEPDGTEQKHNGKTDDDKDDDNEKGGGNGGGESNESSQHHKEDDFDNEPHESDDTEGSNEPSDNGGCFSPGVRSRPISSIEVENDFADIEDSSDCESEALSLDLSQACKISSSEDEEVVEILEVPRRQESIDCHFETIESRMMGIETQSDTSESTDTCVTPSGTLEVNGISEAHLSDRGFVKVVFQKDIELPLSSRENSPNGCDMPEDIHYDNANAIEEGNSKRIISPLGEQIMLNMSDYSSCLDTDDCSDFDSALEEEFWKNTSALEEVSESNNSIVSVDEDESHNCVLQSTSVCSTNEDDECVSDVEFESANENEDEEEIMEIKYSNDGSEKTEKHKQCFYDAVDNENLHVDSDHEDEHSDKNKHTRKARLEARNLCYNIPYFKQEAEEIIDPNVQSKLKYISSLRRTVLQKALPQFDTIDCEFDLLKTPNKHYVENDIDWKMIQNNALNSDSNLDVNDNERTGIRNLGQGFYIFGAANGLPGVPKLKKHQPNLDNKINKRSIYFRGVPGILHNANKMSHYMFPKLAFPKESASRKILHACNRLATQLSPLSPCVEFRHGIMQEDKNSEGNGSDSTLSLGLGDLLMAAKDLLNSSRLEDAETAFLKLYKEIQEKPEDSACLLVETLSGLADICIRRSRMCRSNPLEWQWLCMHAIALLQYTVEFCESELENQLDNQEIEWFTEQKTSSENKCRPLEDAFLRALYNCLKHDANSFDPFQSFSVPNTPVSHSKVSRLFPLSSTMPQYLVVPGMRYRLTDKGMTKQCADDVDVTVDWLAKFQHYCKDRLQSKDSRGVTEKILKSQNDSKAEDDTESCMSHGSHDSLDWDHSDLQGIDEITEEAEEESPVSDFSLEYELVLGDSENEGWDFFLHQRRNCNLESVVQVGNNFEKDDERDKESRKLAIETSDIYHQEKNEKTEKVKKKHSEPRDIVSPLHAHSISLTLARSFCRLADKLVHEEEYRKAEAVYEKILDIVDTIQDGTAGMLRFSARIMKNLGTVKSKQGKSSSGLVLLNKALNTYRDLQDEEANFEIAVALIELGNGYIVGKNHEDSVFDDVIVAICDFFEKDASDSHSASTSSSGSASQISQMTSSLGSNSEERNVEEAVMCYSEAISLLDHYEADDKQMDMFAKAVMRLGDCHFMQKDYDKALESYEKALGMFKTNNVYGKDSLMENAHVLCMLGVSSFMLHVYPRAASVFEMALHMVRCAYGFKRTYLNGMLQSLSGITYYKMKNYHKCVSMCYQGYETYCEIFGEGMSRLDKQKFWLVCQTLYVMGNSYNILNLQQKAMKYLKTARSLMKSSKCRERRQFMRVLQILGDAYFAQYDYKTALQYYNEALEYGECESQISFDEVFDPNCASDEMTIHNHLVSKSAEAHLSMQQYQNAVHYLEQAHDMQEVMGEDIKEDLINTLNQLGHMHSVAGDVNKAIESYKECLEVFSEIHKGKLGPEMCTTLGNLGAICYVKACISDSLEEEDEMTMAADSYFQDAIKLDRNAEVCVKYGNFLYSQCNFSCAIMYLNDALHVDHATCDIVYGGLEKVTLPELLQDEVDTQEEICLPSSCLARYLLILSHKAIFDMDMAEHNLICLMDDVTDYDIPLLHSLLGYAMMEMMLFEEAARCFLTAAESEEDYQLAYENYCVCILVMIHRTLRNGLENIVDHYRKLYRSTYMNKSSMISFRYTT